MVSEMLLLQHHCGISFFPCAATLGRMLDKPFPLMPSHIRVSYGGLQIIHERHEDPRKLANATSSTEAASFLGTIHLIMGALMPAELDAEAFALCHRS